MTRTETGVRSPFAQRSGQALPSRLPLSIVSSIQNIGPVLNFLSRVEFCVSLTPPPDRIAWKGTCFSSCVFARCSVLVGTVSASTLSQASPAVADTRGKSNTASRPEQTSFASVLGAQAEAEGSPEDPPTQAVARAPLEIPGKNAPRSRRATKQPKQESGADPSANSSVAAATTIPASLQTPPAQAAMMFSSNGAGGTVISPDVSGPSLGANCDDKTSTATAVDQKEPGELISSQASPRETLVRCQTALTPSEQMPAEADEDFQGIAHIEETAAFRDTPFPEMKNDVEPHAPVSGSFDEKLGSPSAAASLSEPVSHFTPQTAPELKAQSAIAARQIPEAAATAAATAPAPFPAATATAPQRPDRGDVSPARAGETGTAQHTGPIQAAVTGFPPIAVLAPVKGSSNPTIVPPTTRSRISDRVGSAPVQKTAQLAPPTTSDDEDSSQDSDSAFASPAMASLALQLSPAAIATMHSTAAGQPPSAMPIQPVPSPEALGSTQSTAGKTNAQTIPLHDDSASPRTVSPTPPSPTLQAGRILERMGQSEMHVGIKTVDFGTIEVHTSLSQDRVGASLSTSHAELRSAMEAELPSLQQAISRHHLQLDAFDVASHTGGQGGDSSNDSRPRSFTNGQPGRILPSRESESAVSAPTTSSWIPPHSSRLSVIA